VGLGRPVLGGLGSPGVALCRSQEGLLIGGLGQFDNAMGNNITS
jgi:hypothetical protein